jgi:hypothetical protein
MTESDRLVFMRAHLYQIGKKSDCATSMTILTLLSLQDTFAIAQLPFDSAIPDWATRGRFCSITRTAEDLSIVCREDDVPGDVAAERGWRCLRIAGKLDFAMVGVLASVIIPLAAVGIAVFVVSTFDTDYLLVKEQEFAAASRELQRAGHRVVLVGP